MLSSVLIRCLPRRNPLLSNHYKATSALFSTTKTIKKSSFVVDDDRNEHKHSSVASILEKVSNGILSINHAEDEILRMATTMAEPRKIQTPKITIDNDEIPSSSQQQQQLLGPFANLDHDRARRTSFPEVVFADGKTPEQLIAILDDMAYNVNRLVKEQEDDEDGDGGTFVTDSQKAILATRVSKELYEQISSTPLKNGTIFYHEIARIISVKASSLSKEDKREESDAANTFTNNTLNPPPAITTGTKIIIACAGTTDIPVAEEAAITLEAAGCTTERIYDVGVAGLHRIINALPKLRHPDVGAIIVCAGMDGALPSVVTGLVSVPVVAVPTSVGYGASFGGVGALLTMLNGCAPGVGVVNIDNGFGAAALAYKCIRSNNDEHK